MTQFIPEKLKEIREMKMYSAYRLAKETELTPSAIYNYEAGIRVPSLDILKKFSEVLEIDINYFLGKEIDFYDPNETLDKVKNLKVKFDVLYAPIKKVALKNGKINPDYMWLLNTLIIDKANWNANIFIRQENRIEFLNQSLMYLENQKNIYDSNVNYLSPYEINRNDIIELFNVLNNISRFGLLKLIIEGRKIINEEKAVIDYDHLDDTQQREVNKILEGIVIKKRMEQRPLGTNEKDDEFLLNNYENEILNLNQINLTLSELNKPISPKIIKKFDKFINELIEEDLL